jgi:predicted anti-sigma-YlaC factor YlaD
MEKISCEMIRDLLESYQEELVTDTTNKVIEQHLRKCEECRKIERKMQIQTELQREQKQKREKSFFRRLISYRYEILGFFTGVVTILVILLLIVVVQELAMELFL